MKGLGDKFLFGLFAQMMRGGVLWLLLQRAVNDRQRVLGVVFFQLGAGEVQQVGHSLRQLER